MRPPLSWPASFPQSLLLVCCLLTQQVSPKENYSPEQIYSRQKENKWFTDGTDTIDQFLRLKPINKKAKGVVLFVGDGMGPSTVTAARILDGQLKGLQGEEHVLSWEKFPHVALSKTYNTNQQVPDSAGTATAFLTGVKTSAAVLSVDEHAPYNNCSAAEGREVLSILMMAERAGLSTGVVTSTRVTHATPAATYAHSASRNWESSAPSPCVDIAQQVIRFKDRFGDGLEVLLGGGRSNFRNKTQRDPEYPKLFGNRKDGRDLTKEWTDQSASGNKFEYVWNKQQFKGLDPSKVDHVMGLFEPDHLKYQTDRDANEPTLSEMASFALQVLQKNPRGFVLLVEGGRIDHAHHSNKPVKALHEAVEMAKAVEVVDLMVSKEEVLMITTADHSHVFTLGGYQSRGHNIFGLVDRGQPTASDGAQYPSLGYTNGPSGLAPNTSRTNPATMNMTAPDIRYEALVKLRSETHGGEDVAVYAAGPQAHVLKGVVEQSVVFHLMDFALCLSESKKELCLREGLIEDVTSAAEGTYDGDN